MCNAYNLKASMAKIGEATRAQLGLDLAFAPGVTPETSNLFVPQAVYPHRDGLILRPADPADPAAGLEPVVAHWNLTPIFHKTGLKAWKASTNNCRSETMATSPTFRDAVKRRRCLIRRRASPSGPGRREPRPRTQLAGATAASCSSRASGTAVLRRLGRSTATPWSCRRRAERTT